MRHDDPDVEPSVGVVCFAAGDVGYANIFLRGSKKSKLQALSSSRNA